MSSSGSSVDVDAGGTATRSDARSSLKSSSSSLTSAQSSTSGSRRGGSGSSAPIEPPVAEECVEGASVPVHEVAGGTFEYAYDYHNDSVHDDGGEDVPGNTDTTPGADDAATEQMNTLATTTLSEPPEAEAVDEADPYEYGPHDAEGDPFRALPLDPNNLCHEHSEPFTATGNEAGAEPVIRVRPTSPAARRLPQTTDDADVTSPEEVFRRRSFSSSPYVPASPEAPLTTREANLLELLENALQLTNVLSQTLHDVDRRAQRRQVPTTTTATAGTTTTTNAPEALRTSPMRRHHRHPRRDEHAAYTTETTQKTQGEVPACPRCGCGVCAEAEGNGGLDGDYGTPRRLAARGTYAVAGRWEAQLRQPERARPQSHHAARATSGVAHQHTRTRHTSAHGCRTNSSVAVRNVGSFPFTSRAPARVPVNATNRFTVPKESRRRVPYTASHTTPPPHLESPHVMSEHQQTRAHSARCHHHDVCVAAEKSVSGRGASVDARHSRHQRTGGPSCFPSRVFHGAPCSRRPCAHDGVARQRAGVPPSASRGAAEPSVGSEFDYCLRQLREDYWEQSHQVLAQLESMLREGD